MTTKERFAERFGTKEEGYKMTNWTPNEILAFVESEKAIQREEDIKRMVDRFLGWKLPESFAPDCNISFDRKNLSRAAWPIGTNLFTATEAEEMVRYMLTPNHNG